MRDSIGHMLHVFYGRRMEGQLFRLRKQEVQQTAGGNHAVRQLVEKRKKTFVFGYQSHYLVSGNETGNVATFARSGDRQAHLPLPLLALLVAFSMSEQTYDSSRARNLENLLRALAKRIQELDKDGLLLQAAPELTRIIGDVRSELFHYEVRVTYDTPEIAESRRIVAEAKNQEDGDEWRQHKTNPDEDGDQHR
jgi:hypothetical protein